VSQQLKKDSSEIQEVKASEIEERLHTELAKRRVIERQLIILNEQVRNQKQIEHLQRLANFIQTR
jgi:hypothetical protein